MFGVSGEHLLILVIVLLFFAPSRLPALASVLGKSIRNFKDSIKGIHEPDFKRLDNEDKK